MAASGLISALVSLLQGIEGLEQVVDTAYGWPGSFPAAVVELAKLAAVAPQELGAAEVLKTTLTVTVINQIASQDAAASARDKALDLSLQLRKSLYANPTLDGAALAAKPGPAELSWQTRDTQDYVLITTQVIATTEET